ncbi:MAG: hypothetical protein RBR10_09115 [Bacteroidales bacterium]|nr:hypothetical protein [Bacteroidales bacterium]
MMKTLKIKWIRCPLERQIEQPAAIHYKGNSRKPMQIGYSYSYYLPYCTTKHIYTLGKNDFEV